MCPILGNIRSWDNARVFPHLRQLGTDQSRWAVMAAAKISNIGSTSPKLPSTLYGGCFSTGKTDGAILVVHFSESNLLEMFEENHAFSCNISALSCCNGWGALVIQGMKGGDVPCLLLNKHPRKK